MPAPLSKEHRERFALLTEEGLSGMEASRRLQDSAATGARWRRQIYASGAVRIARMGRPLGSGELAPHIAFFRDLVAQDPDITLFELRNALANSEQRRSKLSMGCYTWTRAATYRLLWGHWLTKSSKHRARSGQSKPFRTILSQYLD